MRKDEAAPEPIHFDLVADLYDSYVFVDFDLDFWLREAVAVPGRVLELASGTGRITIPLLKAHVDLICVDHSSGMLARLEQKLADNGLTCPVYCQDIAALDLPYHFDLIIYPFNSFSEIVDASKRCSALQRIRAHLNSNGTFICTMHNPIVRIASMDGVSHLIGEFALPDGGMLRVRAVMNYDPGSQLASGEQVYELFSHDGRPASRRHLDVNFHLFTGAEFERLISEAGFSIDAVYGNYAYGSFDATTSPFMIWKLHPR